MKKIILTRGIQGSGKSTWAKKWVSEKPESRVRFNNDDIRNMLGIYWVPSRESIVSRLKRAFLIDSMLGQYDIVIDNMNLNPKEEEYYLDMIEKFNKYNHDTIITGKLKPYELEFKDFFISVDECIRRDSMRENPIGEKVIKETWRKYHDKILQIENKHLYDRLNSQDATLPHAIIVDLDATVALNITGRPFYGEGCAQGIQNDYAIKPIIDIVNNYKQSVLYVTGRENTKEIHDSTLKWILDNIGWNSSDQLIMRPEKDHSKGDECKKALYENYIKGHYYIDFVLEDSNKVVEMYRSLGLTVLQPNEGKF